MTDYKLLFEIPNYGFNHRTENRHLSRPQILDVVETDGLHLRPPTNLLYFKEPKVTAYPLDLNEGFENYTFRNEDYFKSSISKIENFIMKNENRLLDDGPNEMCKIYTQRSALYHLMMVPHRLYAHPFNNMTVRATKFNDVIYLTQAKSSRHDATKHDTYHFKFEQYCFADSPAAEPNTHVPIDVNKQRYCIYRSRLGNFDMLYSAEINGVKSDTKINDLNDLDELNKCKFVHTKLLTKIPNRSWRTNKKLLNWWIQAYLTKVDDIYFGFKSGNGFIDSPITHTLVRTLPMNQNWDPNTSTAFLHKFLSELDMKMIEVNCPHTVYEFKYDSEEKEKCIRFKIYEGKSEHSFLSEEFIQHMQNK